MTCDISEALEIKEAIIQCSGFYEEMEVFDDEFYIQPSLDSKESSRKKKHQTFIRKPEKCHAWLQVLAINS